jgi:hypothetical protein
MEPLPAQWTAVTSGSLPSEFSDEDRQILNGFYADRMIPEPLRNRFCAEFDALGPVEVDANIRSGIRKKILERIGSIVNQNPSTYYMSGPPVNGTEWGTLARVISTLYFMDAVVIDFANPQNSGSPDGINRNSIATVSQQQDFLDSLPQSASIRVKTGGRDKPSFATNIGVIPVGNPGNTLELLGKLGLCHYMSDTHPGIMIIWYNQSDVQSQLKIPRCFDAIGYRYFAPNNDPAAQHGLSTHCNSNKDGVPEVVHWSRTVNATRIVLRSL